MISQSCDYTFTNVKTLQIMEMLNNNEEFKHILNINASDVLNLALNVLGLIVEVHDKETTHDDEHVEIHKTLIDDNKQFANYSALAFAVSRAHNTELNEVLLNISENKELTNLVKSMSGDDL